MEAIINAITIVVTVICVLLYFYTCWRFSEVQCFVDKLLDQKAVLPILVQVLLWFLGVFFVLGAPGVIFIIAGKKIELHTHIWSTLMILTMVLGCVVDYLGRKRSSN